ncbi:hypothetical protein [Paraburkholderia flagellata]|uniref:hypothetical protein n=1 Tax=Paraburkholderia flagellata TaxID=2883241 RepID=UPI001F3B5FBB|nr:hypothetical protein [Paraburkholderia flagellata]
MPYEKDVQERQYWWCPKWYWPFAVCSGIRTQHKWCYKFSWVVATGYLAVTHYEGCENGLLYTWTKPFGGIGTTYYPNAGEMCFDSSLGSNEGRCDGSPTGMEASVLSLSAPYASPIHETVTEMRPEVVESGTFDFTGNNKRLCQEGLWPWQRTLHEQSVTATVITRFGNVQWYVSGIALSSNSGTVALSAYCTWPFPLPNGRSENRVINIKYDIQTATDRSTLVLYNDPADGAYSIPIEIIATDTDTNTVYASRLASVDFCGESCDFDAAHEADLARCLKAYSNRYVEKPNLGIPSPEPQFLINDDLWKVVPTARTEIVNSLLAIMTGTFQRDPQIFTEASILLSNQINVPDIARFTSIKFKTVSDINNGPWRAGGCGCGKRLIGTIALLGIGLAVGCLVRSRARS